MSESRVKTDAKTPSATKQWNHNAICFRDSISFKLLDSDYEAWTFQIVSAFTTDPVQQSYHNILARYHVFNDIRRLIMRRML